MLGQIPIRYCNLKIPINTGNLSTDKLSLSTLDYTLNIFFSLTTKILQMEVDLIHLQKRKIQIRDHQLQLHENQDGKVHHLPKQKGILHQQKIKTNSAIFEISLKKGTQFHHHQTKNRLQRKEINRVIPNTAIIMVQIQLIQIIGQHQMENLGEC